jgi:hypothetical protein
VRLAPYRLSYDSIDEELKEPTRSASVTEPISAEPVAIISVSSELDDTELCSRNPIVTEPVSDESN